MNKKQLTAFLKVVGKDKDIPALTMAHIGTYKDRAVLVGTNKAVAAVVYLDEDALELVGKTIRRDALELWNRAATGKSRLTGEELKEVVRQDYALHNGYYSGEYPKVLQIVEKCDTLEVSPQERMTFNGEYFKVIQDLTGEPDLTFSLYGEALPMVSRTEMGVFIVMPIIKKEK